PGWQRHRWPRVGHGNGQAHPCGGGSARDDRCLQLPGGGWGQGGGRRQPPARCGGSRPPAPVLPSPFAAERPRSAAPLAPRSLPAAASGWAIMKPPPFDYVRAATLAEAHAVLAAEGADARVIAGGQTLVPMLSMRLARPKVLVDIMHLRELA